MGKCLGEPVLRVHCAKHKCDLVENEHYENWVQCADFSGFYCPRDNGNIRPYNCECDNTHEQAGSCCLPCWEAGFRTVCEDCSDHWRVSPIGDDNIDIFDVLKEPR